MKALTLWQPWSWATAHAGKRVENRMWAPPERMLGERIAIHAGKREDADATCGLEHSLGDHVPCGILGVFDGGVCRMHGRHGCTFVHGAVESVATLAGAARWPSDATHWTMYDGIVDVMSGRDLWALFESPWRIPGMWHWLLEDVIALPEPVPCRGAQGLWTLPEDVERKVNKQLERSA